MKLFVCSSEAVESKPAKQRPSRQRYFYSECCLTTLLPRPDTKTLPPQKESIEHSFE